MWQSLLTKWLTHLRENRPIESFFLMSTENSHEMKTVYTRLGNVTEFTEWLESKAEEEAQGFSTGGTIFFVEGGI